MDAQQSLRILCFWIVHLSITPHQHLDALGIPTTKQAYSWFPIPFSWDDNGISWLQNNVWTRITIYYFFIINNDPRLLTCLFPNDQNLPFVSKLHKSARHGNDLQEGLCFHWEFKWMASASNSFPVPVSPWIKTAISLLAISSIIPWFYTSYDCWRKRHNKHPWKYEQTLCQLGITFCFFNKLLRLKEFILHSIGEWHWYL